LLGGWLLAFNQRRTPEFGRTPFWIGSALLIVSLILTAMVSVARENLPSEV
jgi:hypothetical protein